MKFNRNAKILIFSLFGIFNFLAFLFSFRTYSNWKKLKVLKEGVFYDPNRMFDIAEFKYLISKSECGHNGTVPLFITLVHTAPTQTADRRAALRKTWAHSDPRTKTYFFMGKVQSPAIQNIIDEEDKQFNDIIQGNFVDAYHNMTYVHTVVVKWFSENCPHVKYLLKVDDDTFVNVPAMHEFLLNNAKDKMYMAGTPELRTVFRNGKYIATEEEYVNDKYPIFTGAYVIYSSDVAQQVYKKTITTRYFWIDDVFMTGIIRSQLNIKLTELSLSNSCRLSHTGAFPEPMFTICIQISTKDIIELWNWTEPYRQAHPYKMS